MPLESHNSSPKSSAQSEKSSTPLHYRLTNEEWLAVSKELKPAEMIVLYYLRTLDPFGDRSLNLKVIDIAEATGLRKGTVSKALKVLSDKDYIDLEMIVVQIRVKKFPVENQVSCRKPDCTPGNFDARQETSMHGRKLDCAHQQRILRSLILFILIKQIKLSLTPTHPPRESF
jgi:DNA-binding transcriptional ArsR family regulator